MPVDTGKVEGRRKVAYSSLNDVLADAERFGTGNARAIGNWSSGQIFAHLAQVMNNSIDGSNAKFPWYLRVMARMMKKTLLKGEMPPGFKLPKRAARTLEPAPIDTTEGLAALRRAIARQQQETRRAPHPVFGPLTHDEWTRLHLAHSALHMSFLVPGS